MANDGPFLIVDPRPGAARAAAALLGATKDQVAAVPTAEAALAALAAGHFGVMLVAEGPAAAALGELAAASHEAGAGCLLLTDRTPSRATLRQVLAAGADGVVSFADPADEVADSLRWAHERRLSAHAGREEVRRLASQCDGLRERCARLGERMHEAQETFYLDLSRMMTIITNIMDGIVFADRDGNVTLLNPVAEDLLGVKSFVAIGRPITALQGRTELVAALTGDHRRLDGKKDVVQTVELHHSEHDLLYVKCITSRVLDYRGQPAGALSVLKDVTAEYKADQLKNQYLSIVAHELRTPLTGIKTFATMMAKGALGGLSDAQKRACDSMREQSLRLEHQIDKLINLGNLESDDYAQDRELFGVGELANALLLPFEQPARDRGIELRLVVEPSELLLHAGRADLRRACQALIENAVKFAPDGGHVEVRIAAVGHDGLEFGVRDDGIGIDPRYHRRIFEKFFQVEDPLTRHHGGAGLGLFVARGIVEAHGSRIKLSSQLGQGADFSFMLPVRQPTAATVAG